MDTSEGTKRSIQWPKVTKPECLAAFMSASKKINRECIQFKLYCLVWFEHWIVLFLWGEGGVRMWSIVQCLLKLSTYNLQTMMLNVKIPQLNECVRARRKLKCLQIQRPLYQSLRLQTACNFCCCVIHRQRVQQRNCTYIHCTIALD